MKILVISNYTGVNSSRPEAEAIIGIARKGADVTIMTYGHAEYVKKFQENGIRVIDFHPEKKLNKAEIQIIRKELMDGQYDISHLFNGKAIINGIQAAKGLPVKVVLYRGYTGNIHWWDPTAYFKYLHPRVDGVWCIAQGVVDLINRNTLFGKKKAVCIHKGHHPDWYKDVQKADLSAMGIPQDAFVASIVANARPMKGISYLIKSTWYLPADIPFYLLLIGEGLETPEIKKLVAKSPHASGIIFTGYRADGLSLVKSCDVFVLSSLFGEATTKSVIEAMSVGVAPLITDIPGNRGLVIDGECGLVVPSKDPEAMGNALYRLYQNPQERNAFALAAQKHIAENFRLEKTIEELYAYYIRLISS